MHCHCEDDSVEGGRNKKLIEGYPIIHTEDDADSQGFEVSDNIRRINALISCFLHIPFPELLSDEMWMEKYRQVEWLAEKGVIGTKVPQSVQ